jgi:hypothetical protein
MGQLVQIESIEQKILYIRKQKVMIDADLAAVYGVSTKVLNQAVKRNIVRFPSDFMFKLTAAEKKKVVTNCDHLKHLKYSSSFPYAFTEHGAIMLASVLNSPKAVESSIYVVRAFVRLREFISSYKEISKKLADLEHKYISHDHQIKAVFDAIRQLMVPPKKKRYRVGF